MKVLIVDDSARFRLLIRSSLAELNAEFAECSDGDEAASFYAQCRPDITLMDIRMPRMNGLRATREIKAQNQDAKIIILTTLDEDTLRQAAREAGASAYALKDDLKGLMQLILEIVPSERA